MRFSLASKVELARVKCVLFVFDSSDFVDPSRLPTVLR